MRIDTYDTTKNLRPTSMTYPSGTTVNYGYGTSSGIDDLASRPATVALGTTTQAGYAYTGSGQALVTTYNVPGLSLDYTSGGLDRFGRIIDHAWKKSSTDLVRIKHGYDYNGNRLYREDTAALANSKYFDEFYTYDGINQVTGMTRGTLNAGKTAIGSNKNNAEGFTFDKTGNFSNYKQDTNGNGTFDVNQNRVHSKANEITSIGGSATNTGVDRNGNMTKVIKPDNASAAFDLVYDAWNRIVTVKDGSTTVASYTYNGMNHRVTKSTGSETRLYYYNNEWQCLEEYVGGVCDKRYVWGLRYIDDLVMYRVGATDYYSVADPNWNVAAVTNASGVVQERYTYSAFGKPNFFDASFTSKSASTISNTRLFTGQVLDSETNLMLYRNRYYHPTLGRFVSRDPIGYDARDVNLMRYVGNSVQTRIDDLGTMSIMPVPPNRHPIWLLGPPLGHPSPGNMRGGQNPRNLFGMENGWNQPWWNPDFEDMEQECCNMSSDPPSPPPVGPSSGNYQIHGLPSDQKYIGTGGAATCTAVVIKCDEYVYVYHFTPGDHPHFYNAAGSNCEAIVCGGDPNQKGSKCLKKEAINRLKKAGIGIAGVSSESACGWVNDEKGGWYTGGGKN